MKKKKVLYITYDGLTDSLGQSQILPYIIGLSKKGYIFTVLSAEKKDNFFKNKNIVEEQLNRYSISWKKIWFRSYPPFVSKLIDMCQLQILAYYLQKRNKFDLVHCRSYVASYVGLNLKKRFKVKYLFDMRGFWVDERVEGGIWNTNKIIYKWIYRYYKKEKKI